jgi:hypothetical protein
MGLIILSVPQCTSFDLFWSGMSAFSLGAIGARSFLDPFEDTEIKDYCMEERQGMLVSLQ